MTERDLQLPERFIKDFPELSADKAQKLYNRYLNVLRKTLFRALPYIEGDIISFPLKQAQDMCGDFQYKNKRYYVWHEFLKLRPFFTIYKKGNKFNGVVSEVKIIDQKYIDLLIDSGDTEELVNTCYSKFDRSNMIMIPIDMTSLTGYISKTEYQLPRLDTTDPRCGKLQRNLRTAKYFKIIAEYFYDEYGDYVIPHIPSDKKQYGRIYYKGMNLQNCTKEVRAAALGDHISYDLNAAVYAIKLLLVRDIYDEFGHSFEGQFTYTKEYLDHKSHIREELASLIKCHMPNYPDTLKLVKEAMTAIGFGAKLHEGSWEYEGLVRYNALHYIIYNKDARASFAKHKFVSNFLREQNDINKIIYEYFSRDNQFIEKVKDMPDMWNNNGKLLKSKTLAYLYQHAETQIMDIAVKDIIPHLRIHDCFIMLKPIPSETMKSIKSELYEYSPYLNLVKEEVSGWTNQQIIDDESKHKQFITQEELKAKNYQPEYVLRDNNNIEVKKRKYEYTNVLNDSMPYDGYDDGTQYDNYDEKRDESVSVMTLEEKREHYRILGHEPNILPDHIKKIL
jgi:hypothetical protein